MLKMDMRPGEQIKIGDAIVKLVKKSGQVATICIDAARNVHIERVIKEEKPKTDAE